MPFERLLFEIWVSLILEQGSFCLGISIDYNLAGAARRMNSATMAAKKATEVVGM
jgi:hypothetical protein